MPKDIVCGKEVRNESAINTTYGDRIYSFCSEKCERDFSNNPLKYVNPSGAAAATEGSPKITETGETLRSKV